MIITEISNQLSLTASVVAFMFAVYHYKHYRYLIIVPFLMAMSSVTYGVIEQPINDILYDLSYIVITIFLVFSRVNYKLNTDDDCGSCRNYKK